MSQNSLFREMKYVIIVNIWVKQNKIEEMRHKTLQAWALNRGPPL